MLLQRCTWRHTRLACQKMPGTDRQQPGNLDISEAISRSDTRNGILKTNEVRDERTRIAQLGNCRPDHQRLTVTVLYNTLPYYSPVRTRPEGMAPGDIVSPLVPGSIHSDKFRQNQKESATQKRHLHMYMDTARHLQVYSKCEHLRTRVYRPILQCKHPYGPRTKGSRVWRRHEPSGKAGAPCACSGD